MLKKLFFLTLVLSFISRVALADEGMWLPLLLKGKTMDEMKKKGFKLSAEDLYSVNHSSLKDAIVIFGGGCTGELISNEGLLITNHHCGFDAIQNHSSLQHDYLTDGFWATNKKDELTNMGLTCTFLVRMESVTKQVMKGVTPEMSQKQRFSTIDANIGKIIEAAKKGTHYEASVKPLFYGNEYYLYVTETFKDIRLVGAPPSAIGKFGGDTDNWMWPRHTGDFSIFRIYANKDNQPADYSADNVPYKPKRALTISLKGVKPNDFTMVFGYPGRTQEYITSFYLDLIYKTQDPNKVNIRSKKLEIIKADMESDPLTRIKYASKESQISNAWKKWKGEIRGLRQMDALTKKQQLEADFTKWVESKEKRKKKYAGLLDHYKKVYQDVKPYTIADDYAVEAGTSLDILLMAGRMNDLTLNSNKQNLKKIREYALEFYKDYNKSTDKKLFSTILQLYYDSLYQKGIYPAIFDEIKTKYNGSFAQYAEEAYAKSFLCDSAKTMQFLDSIYPSSIATIKADPFYRVYFSINNMRATRNMPNISKCSSLIDSLNRIWMQGLREFQPKRAFYPDANFTLRIAFGKVSDYQPRDGVRYDYYTTLDGIIEKNNPDIYDYRVPKRLMELHQNKDYGEYGMKDKMPVAFIGTNHTTGGNSGSPVLNADGELIGVNFDRCWEGTMSDLMFDPDHCRNIALDIRYALFIIDKFAGAGQLVKEMNIKR